MLGFDHSAPARPARNAFQRPGERAMDYKATLNLPRTDFPMRANLP